MEVEVYEFDLTVGTLGDSAATKMFTRDYNRHLADGWEAWRTNDVVLNGGAQSIGGVARVGLSINVVIVWRRLVKPEKVA
jgi:hypothetical protein